MNIKKWLGINVWILGLLGIAQAQPEEKIEPIQFSKEDIERYAPIYENPYVQHVRRIFNGYLHGFPQAPEAGYCFENEQEILNQSNGKDVLGLADYRAYIKHPFVVMEANPAIMGGMTLAILFPKQPDKLFSVWVYDIDEAGGCFEMRSFRQLPQTEEEVAKLVHLYKKLIFKKKYSI